MTKLCSGYTFAFGWWRGEPWSSWLRFGHRGSGEAKAGGEEPYCVSFGRLRQAGILGRW